MFLWEGTILSNDNCEETIKSVIDFNQAGLYYTGNNGTRHKAIISSQRNALTSELYLTKDTELYDKINLVTNKVGYRLVSEKIKYQVVRYDEGHFIYKHRHDMDGGIFLTIVIQLSDKSDYTGGDFLYWLNNKEYTLPQKIGYGLLIGPEVEHEVKVVTKGSRYSFVLFLEFSDVESTSKQSLI
jgi:hypothetical protein